MSKDSRKDKAASGASSSTSRRGRSTRQTGEARDPTTSPRTLTRSASVSASTSASTRAARRLSVEPYTRPAALSREASMPAEGTAVVEEGQASEVTPATAADATEPTATEPEQGGSNGSAKSNGSSPTSASALPIPDLRSKRFELTIVQQPEIGAEAGMSIVTLGRLPIVPAPVVQVRVREQDGTEIDAEMPFLFCTCTLKREDGVTSVELARPDTSAPAAPPITQATTSTSSAGSSEVEDEFSALIGSLVRSPHYVLDLDGRPASFFVFEDMSVRMLGRFRLEFRLGEARGLEDPKLASVISEPFDVVPWEAYPGRPAAATVPELSRHLRAVGVPMYIPPLVITPPGADEPPPPGSNPFPAGATPDVADQGE